MSAWEVGGAARDRRSAKAPWGGGAGRDPLLHREAFVLHFPFVGVEVSLFFYLKAACFFASHSRKFLFEFQRFFETISHSRIWHFFKGGQAQQSHPQKHRPEVVICFPPVHIHRRRDAGPDAGLSPPSGPRPARKRVGLGLLFVAQVSDLMEITRMTPSRAGYGR